MSVQEPDRGGRRDDVDERFRRIMDAEFGGSPAPRHAAPRHTAPHPSTPHPSAPDEPTGHEVPAPTGGADFNLTAALDEVVADQPAEPFVAPTPSPLPRPKGFVAVGVTLVTLGLLTTLATLVGVGPGQRWGAWAIGAMVVGLAILLFSIPRTPRDPWDDGARI